MTRFLLAAALSALHVNVYGNGADRVWVYTPAHAQSVVVFVHGHGDPDEDTPIHHQAWIEHLVRKGNVVLYPAYESFPGDKTALVHLVRGVRGAMAHVPARLPIVGIGYSRGGQLVVDWAAMLRPPDRQPRAIYSVFAAWDELPRTPDYSALPPFLRFELLWGDQDTVVGKRGPATLLVELEEAGVPARRIHVRGVHSHGAFQATHLSVLEDTPGARAAFWAPADRLIASVR